MLGTSTRHLIYECIFSLISLLAVGRWAHAHHSSLLYENERLVQIEGVVTKAFFGNPHSRYTIRASDAETWTMIAQDPEDARRFGYFDELKALQQGDAVRIIGWPHRHNNNELLGH